ncbi:DUF2484 family protein [Wenxinia marina]|uniref:Wenxma_12, whole genome shotgun sequence n=1 Tax=Wenxinia marina DSM 24838 TaxID=1123501 RepID=A0A0D0Q847_9RHOB|nr:DUF2484 family protein [Wenxinia marina]KIQ68592.1 hypothetical protein Wenmar_02863 [Wenxinia marina DSM 24838]GGL67164.1 hypothetical protein GCM10011392_22060 [Wenxinia marina]
MNAPLMAACLWFVLAHVLALIPSNDHHWRRAYFLIAVGIPILGWVTATSGPVLGLLVLAAGASVLRWPLVHLARWVRRGLSPDRAESVPGE